MMFLLGIRSLLFPVIALLALVLPLVATMMTPLVPPAEALAPVSVSALPISGVRVSGNKLVDSTGQTVLLHGVDRSGSEYMCTGGGALTFDGPADQASIDAMKSWGVN